MSKIAISPKTNKIDVLFMIIRIVATLKFNIWNGSGNHRGWN
jgi:hypothetical protein